MFVPNLSMPLVSVIIPCYNQGHFLIEAIESVYAQTYERVEILVVDDGSTDQTEKVAFQQPFVRVIRQRNQGLAAARNTGLLNSNGDYLVFLDADDRLLPNALKYGLECFRTHSECVFVFGRFRRISAEGKILANIKATDIRNGYYEALLQGNHIKMHATVMYRRRIFDIVGGFNTSLAACEDYELYLRIARQFLIASHKNLVAEYRRHETNMSNNLVLMLTSALRVLRLQWPYVKEKPTNRVLYRVGILSWHLYFCKQLIKIGYASLRRRSRKQFVETLMAPLRYVMLQIR